MEQQNILFYCAIEVIVGLVCNEKKFVIEQISWKLFELFAFLPLKAEKEDLETSEGIVARYRIMACKAVCIPSILHTVQIVRQNVVKVEWTKRRNNLRTIQRNANDKLTVHKIE